MVENGLDLANGPAQRSRASLAHWTVVGWNGLLLTIWLAYVLLLSTGVERGSVEGLAVALGLMVAVGAITISYLIGLVTMLILERRPRWRPRLTSARGALLTGTLAAAIGFSPIGLLFLWSVATDVLV